MDIPLIVVINHEKVFLDLMHEVLTGEGYAVRCWHAFDATFSRLQAAHPALAIIDINAHDRDAAWVLLERIHNETTTASIPVIVCTADRAYVHRRASDLLQFNYTIIDKPFNLEDMLQQVRAMLTPGGAAPFPGEDNRAAHHAA